MSRSHPSRDCAPGTAPATNRAWNPRGRPRTSGQGGDDRPLLGSVQQRRLRRWGPLPDASWCRLRPLFPGFSPSVTLATDGNDTKARCQDCVNPNPRPTARLNRALAPPAAGRRLLSVKVTIRIGPLWSSLASGPCRDYVRAPLSPGRAVICCAQLAISPSKSGKLVAIGPASNPAPTGRRVPPAQGTRNDIAIRWSRWVCATAPCPAQIARPHAMHGQAILGLIRSHSARLKALAMASIGPAFLTRNSLNARACTVMPRVAARAARIELVDMLAARSAGTSTARQGAKRTCKVGHRFAASSARVAEGDVPRPISTSVRKRPLRQSGSG